MTKRIRYGQSPVSLAIAKRPSQAFTFMVDRQDDKVVSLFSAHLTTYIHEQAELSPDPYQSPKIRPFDGTVLQDPLLNEDQLGDHNQGLLAISNDSGSSDESEVYDKPGHI